MGGSHPRFAVRGQVDTGPQPGPFSELVVHNNHNRANGSTDSGEKANVFNCLFLEIQLLLSLHRRNMDCVAMLFLASVGTTCIYAGYRLFCDLPAVSRQGPHVNRAAVFLLNIVPGVLLSVSGSALLTAEARVALSHRPAVRHYEPAADDTPSLNQPSAGPHRFMNAVGHPLG